MASFGEAPTVVKVALILVTLGVLLHVIGFSTTYWRNYEYSSRLTLRIKIHSGLWSRCSSSRLGSSCRDVAHTPSWFEATQAFETLGFIAAIAALVLVVLYIFVPATSGKRIVVLLSMMACFAAAGCIILGIIIYGAKTKDNLSWSYALCTIAGIIFGVSGVLLVLDMMKR